MRRWHGIALPNAPAGRLAEQLTETIEAYAALRAPPALEAAPGDFAATLAALRDDGLDEDRGKRGAAGGMAATLAGLREGSLSARAVLEASLERIDRHEAALNAVIWQDRAGARAAAEAADAARAGGGGLGPLHGLPLAHKDMFGTPGQRETAGAAAWREHCATTRATATARLAAAGSIAFAGLNMAEFAQNPTGHNATFGDCLNPWHAAMISGGSSSGSAAAVAAGYCAGSLGTDTGGSIRLPAACCGVTGLKTTWGRVSRAGVVPLCAALDTVGPIGRTASDCAILLGVIAGADPDDPTAAAVAVPDYAAALTGEVRGQRIGVPEAGFVEDAEPEVRAAIAAALARLAALGATLVPVAVPLLDEIAAYGGVVARVEAAALHAGWMRTQPARYATHISARLYPGYAIPATYYVEAMARRPAIVAGFVQAVFGGVDVLATPTLRGRAPSRAETDIDRGPAGAERRFFAIGGNTRPFNYLGLPALSLPCGFDANGVPIGLQLVGRPFGEARLLRVADAYQRDAGPPPSPSL